MGDYGKELVLDIHDCDSSFFNRKSIESYLTDLCVVIDMKRQVLHFWDDVGLPSEECQTEPHLKGTSAIQFIMTSNITIHVLDILEHAYVNIFSCKDFDHKRAAQFTAGWFHGKIVHQEVLRRH